MKKTSYPLQDIRVLRLEGVSQTAVDTFRDAGYTSIDLHANSLPEDELRRRIADAHFIGIRPRTQPTAEALADARRLLAVACFCIRTNHVDPEAPQLPGIPVDRNRVLEAKAGSVPLPPARRPNLQTTNTPTPPHPH